MNFYNKVKWILGILMIFILVIATNLIDRNNFLKIKDSVASIYNDRLVAKDLIFELSQSLHKKEIALLNDDYSLYTKKTKKEKESIANFISRFEATKLTSEEYDLFENLKENLLRMQQSEDVYIQSEFTKKADLGKHIAIVNEDLYALAKIQLNEGGVQMSITKKAFDSIELFTHIEIYVLIFLAVVIQIIVIYKPKDS